MNYKWNLLWKIPPRSGRAALCPHHRLLPANRRRRETRVVSVLWGRQTDRQTASPGDWQEPHGHMWAMRMFPEDAEWVLRVYSRRSLGCVRSFLSTSEQKSCWKATTGPGRRGGETEESWCCRRTGCWSLLEAERRGLQGRELLKSKVSILYILYIFLGQFIVEMRQVREETDWKRNG